MELTLSLKNFFDPWFKKLLYSLKTSAPEEDTYTVCLKVGLEAEISPLRVWWHLLDQVLGEKLTFSTSKDSLIEALSLYLED